MTNNKKKTVGSRKKVNTPGSTHQDQFLIDLLLAQASTPALVANKALANADTSLSSLTKVPKESVLKKQTAGLLKINQDQKLASIYRANVDTLPYGGHFFVPGEKYSKEILQGIQKYFRRMRQKGNETIYRDTGIKRLNRLPKNPSNTNSMIFVASDGPEYLAHEMGHAQQYKNFTKLTRTAYPFTGHFRRKFDATQGLSTIVTVAAAHEARRLEANGTLTDRDRKVAQRVAGAALLANIAGGLPTVIHEGGANLRAIRLLKQTGIPANPAQKKRLAAAWGTYVTGSLVSPSIAGVAYLTMPKSKKKKK